MGRLQPLSRSRRRQPEPRGQLRPPVLVVHGSGQRLPHVDVPAVLRAERLGMPVSYFTNVDLHLRPDALAGATATSPWAMTSTGRPPCARSSPRARGAGTNLAILGANTMYWRVRLEDDGGRPARRMVGYRSGGARPGASRGPDDGAVAGRPRRRGRSTSCWACSTSATPSTPTTSSRRPGWWGFRGTAVRAGDGSRGWSGPRPTGSTPTALAPADAGPQRLAVQLRRRADRAQSVYFTTESGPRSSTPGRCAGSARWPIAASGRWGTDHRVRQAGDRQHPPRVLRRPGGSRAPGPRQRRPTSRSRAGEHGPAS